MRIYFNGVLLAVLLLIRGWFTNHYHGRHTAYILLDFPILALMVRQYYLRFSARAEYESECESKKKKETERKIESEIDYSVKEWMKIRGLARSSETAAAPIPGSRASKPLPAAVASTPTTQEVSPDEPVYPPGPTWGQLFKRLIGATILTISYFLIWHYSINVVLPYCRMRSSYEATRATVLETSVVHGVWQGEGVYSPRLRVRYKANGASREQWCDIDRSRNYRSPDCAITGNGLRYYLDRSDAENELRPYSAGRVLPAWYEPGRPEMVVVPKYDLQGTFVICVVLGVILIGKIVVPAVGLFGKALRHRVALQRTTGRVLRGEVRIDSDKSDLQYCAVIHVERDDHASALPLAIEGSKFLHKSAAAAELGQVLAAHPVGQTTPVWFDPRGRVPPTFHSFGFFNALMGAVAIVLRPPVTLLTMPFQVFAKIERIIFPPSAKRGLPPSRGRDLFYASMALLTLALMGYYVFQYDYSMYTYYEPVTATVLQVGTVPRDGGYVPRLELIYKVAGNRYKRHTDEFWFFWAPKDQFILDLTQQEAEEIASHYQVGDELQIWAHSFEPFCITPQRHLHWPLYPLLIPPLVLLFILVRRARRSSGKSA